MTGFKFKVEKDFDMSRFVDLLARFKQENRAVNVGFPAGPEHKDSDGSGSGITVAELAAIHEFGAPNAGIPERSFLRSALVENRPKYVALNRASLKGVLDGKLTIDQALGRLGAFAVGTVQQKIAAGPFTPLIPATIYRKGSSKPLIDSGQMRQSVQWEFTNDRDQ